MSGVTDAPYRRLASRLGAGLVISEMTASDALAKGNAEARLRAEAATSGIHVIQLAGCEAHWMREGAKAAEASGAQIIDINMGCPAKRVTNGYSGSALMRDLNHAMTLIHAVVDAVTLPVTLKMRLGWDTQSMNAPELARRAQDAGVQLVTVHGRTRCQFYNGKADWAAISRVKHAVSIPVVANGDLTTYDDVDGMLAQSGADAIMVGRAAVGLPWLAGQLAAYLADGSRPADPPLEVQRGLLLALHDDILHHYGKSIGVRHARKHVRAALDWAAAASGVASTVVEAARAAALTTENVTQFRRHVADAYDVIAWKAAA
jgi:nifR3 family TIM-barrel protein